MLPVELMIMIIIMNLLNIIKVVFSHCSQELVFNKYLIKIIYLSVCIDIKNSKYNVILISKLR